MRSDNGDYAGRCLCGLTQRIEDLPAEPIGSIIRMNKSFSLSCHIQTQNLCSSSCDLAPVHWNDDFLSRAAWEWHNKHFFFPLSYFFSNSYTNLPITGILPLVHLITPAPHTPPIKQAQRMHQYTRSRYTRPGKRTIHIPVQHHDTPICTPHSHIHTRSHLGLLRNTTQRRH